MADSLQDVSVSDFRQARRASPRQTTKADEEVAGQISVVSEVTKGSTFHSTAVQCVGGLVPVAVSYAVEPGDVTVLIVDDNVTNRRAPALCFARNRVSPEEFRVFTKLRPRRSRHRRGAVNDRWCGRQTPPKGRRCTCLSSLRTRLPMPLREQ